MSDLAAVRAAEKVAKGAALLDLKFPGWWADVTLSRLEMSDVCDCIVGQAVVKVPPGEDFEFAFASYREFVRSLDGDAADYGFDRTPFADLGDDRVEYEDLQVAWANVVAFRQAHARGVALLNAEAGLPEDIFDSPEDDST